MKQANKNTKDLYVLFGPPGAGKSTQALLLQEKLGFYYLSWGKISREIMSNHGAYKSCYKIVKKLTEENSPFPDGFVSGVLSQEIGRVMKEHSSVKGILLDGFPRRIREAEELLEILKEHNLNLNTIIKFNINYETIKYRIEERACCPRCGRFYNKTIRPKIDGVCDEDKVKLIKRPDDYEETIKDRFDSYMKESIDAFDFLVLFAKTSFDVNANQNDISLFAEIVTKMDSKIKNCHHVYRRVGKTELQTEFGKFDLIGYQDIINYDYHVVLTKGDLANKRGVPVRIHSSCITGDIFHSQKCDCGDQLHNTLKHIEQHGSGAVIYLFQEGRGINIINKIKAYKLQAEGVDTVEANECLSLPSELREYGMVKDILSDLEIKSINLITNNPEKLNKLQSLGIIIEHRIPIEICSNHHNERYLRTKKEKTDHILTSLGPKDKNIELEIKFLINDNDVFEIKEKISKIPDIFYAGNVYEKTTMLDNSVEQMNKDDARLRVRQIGEQKDDNNFKIEFCYKRRICAKGGIKKEEEIETMFTTDIVSFFRILNKMGYEITTSYERYRETYKTKNVKVTLDKFPFGHILEIEGSKNEINKMCNFLDLDTKKSYPLSCDDAYVELCRKGNKKPKDHILFDDLDMPQLN